MDVAVRTREMKGQTQNGDSFLDFFSGNARVLAVVDGLGHGPLANLASSTAVDLVRKSSGLDLVEMLEAVDAGLRHTRGVAIAVARFDIAKSTLEFGGVGNIEFYSTNKEIKPISYGGVLGHTWKRPKIFEYVFEPGDMFVMFSDGISTRFNLDDYSGLDCGAIAQRIMQNHSKTHDDATVMVISV